MVMYNIQASFSSASLFSSVIFYSILACGNTFLLWADGIFSKLPGIVLLAYKATTVPQFRNNCVPTKVSTVAALF